MKLEPIQRTNLRQTALTECIRRLSRRELEKTNPLWMVGKRLIAWLEIMIVVFLLECRIRRLRPET